MDSIEAKIIIYGDMHLSSKNYGAHRYYPQESLEYFTKITEMAEKERATHIIGLGDFTYGRFNNLEYRAKVEEQLEKQYKLTGGNRWELKGNHDSATYGMTEYEFYIQKGLIRKPENLSINNLNISMVGYGEHIKTDIIEPDSDKVNIVLAHDYFKFSDTQLPNYGGAIDIDYMEQWFGVDMILCGHVHNYHKFSGLMVRGEENKRVVVSYLGCMSRPSYREGLMDNHGTLGCITVLKDGTIDYSEINIELWDIDKSFNLQQRIEQLDIRRNKVDVSDIVKSIDLHERKVGTPEDIIMSMGEVELKYRNRAIQLLEAANR